MLTLKKNKIVIENLQLQQIIRLAELFSIYS